VSSPRLRSGQARWRKIARIEAETLREHFWNGVHRIAVKETNRDSEVRIAAK
jgi:hypothetical protein